MGHFMDDHGIEEWDDEKEKSDRIVRQQPEKSHLPV
jgi:hypothetical protein